MLCPKCGAPVEPGRVKCEACGHTIEPKDNARGNQEQGSPVWFKLLLGLFLLAGLFIGYQFFQTTPVLVSVVQDQVDAIKEENLDKAYHAYTSHEWQEQHSFEDFQELVAQHPVLANNQDFRVQNHVEEGDVATITGTLIGADNTSESVIYRLVKEDGDWKIAKIQFLSPGEAMVADAVALLEATSKASEETAPLPSSQIHDKEDSSAELKKPIEDQLQAFKQKDFEKAYRVTSEEFQEVTPYVNFVSFIREYPHLTEYDSYTFENGREENGKGKISVILIKDGVHHPLEYLLVKEGDAWKIWGFRMAKKQSEEEEPKANADKESELISATTPPSSSSKTPVQLPKKTTEQKYIQPPHLAAPNIAKLQEVDRAQIRTNLEKDLNLLKKNDVEEVYKNVSKEFMDTTSLEAFKVFAAAYPEFSEFRAWKIDDLQPEQENLYLMRLLLDTEKGDSVVEIRWVKDGNEWRIWGMRVSKSAYHPEIPQEEKEAIKPLIEGQLEALKQKDISKAYYAYVSKEFEKITSFDAFQEYLKKYPIFTDYKSYTIENGSIEDNIRTVHVVLNSNEGGQVDADFQYAKEGDKWKIWSIKLYTESLEMPVHNKPEEVMKAINGQLEALKSGDVSKAYYAFNSNEFQDATSEQNFKKFIAQQPIFTQKSTSARLENIQFKGNGVMATVELTGDHDIKRMMEYRLLYTGSQWKVLSIQVASATGDVNAKDTAAQDMPAKEMEISKAVFGTKVDLQGLIRNPATIFSDLKKEITLNLYIENGVAGTEIEVVLEHEESHSKIRPVTMQVASTGDSIATFIFSPPSQGWPEGEYSVHVKSSTGLEKTFHFTVNASASEGS